MKNSNYTFIGYVLFVIVFFVLFSSCNSNKDDDLNLCSLPVVHWEKGDDIIIINDYYVDSFVLVIEAGANIKIKHGCSIIVGNISPGVIIAKGTSDNPINFETYNPEGNSVDDYWGSIDLYYSYCDTIVSEFEYCNFIKGGGDSYDATIKINTKGSSFKNCNVDYSKGYGFFLDYRSGFVEFSGNKINHTLNHPISISVSQVHTIGSNNDILTDSINHGILLNENYLFIRENIEWQAQSVPIIVNEDLIFKGNSDNPYSSLEIKGGVKIACAKNVELKFADNATISVKGTEENPVLFTSNELNKQKGDWNAITFWSDSYADFEYCEFEYGGMYESSVVGLGMIQIYNMRNITFDNCTFRESQVSAINLHNSYINLPDASFTSFTNNTFENLDNYAITMYPQNIATLDYSNNFNGYDIEIINNDDKWDDYLLWKNLGTDYVTSDFFRIVGENSPIVEFEAGVKLKFNNGGFRVGSGSPGKLIASGTADEPVIFTSAKAEPSNGDWWGIQFQQKALDGCLLDNCQVLYAGESKYDFKQAAVHVIYYGSKVTIKNSTIAHSSHGGICISMHAEPILENNTFFDNFGGNGCDEGY